MEPVRAHTIGLLAAVDDELEPTIERLKLEPTERVYAGHTRHMRIVALASGIGAGQAIDALNQLVEWHGAKHVIHLGFAGGLDPALRVGDVPTVQWVIDANKHTVRLTGARPVNTDGDAGRTPARTILTMDHLVESVNAKRQLFENLGACAVDMESFPVAAAATSLGVGLTVLRAISDPADTVMPAAAIKWVKADGSRDIAAAAQHLGKRPWQLPAMLLLRRNAKVAARHLAQCVAQVLTDSS